VGGYLSGNEKYLLAYPVLDHPKTKLNFEVGWLQSVIKTLVIPISMESVPVSPLEDVRLSQVHMDFTDEQDDVQNRGPVSDLTTDASISLPFTLPVDITSLSMDFTLNEFAEVSIDKATWGGNCGCEAAFCVCEEADEGKEFDVLCPDNETVLSSVYFASYGDPTESGCRDTRISKTFALNQECHAAESEQVVADLCLGSRNCTFTVDSEMFASTSSFTYKNASLPNSTGCSVFPSSGRNRPLTLVAAFVCASSLGHSTDVTSQVKAQCDGKRECSVEMTDASLSPVSYDRGVCQRELTVEYTCSNSDLNFVSR
jgi:hypothetical protein